jgi:hypothetical protein
VEGNSLVQCIKNMSRISILQLLAISFLILLSSVLCYPRGNKIALNTGRLLPFRRSELRSRHDNKNSWLVQSKQLSSRVPVPLIKSTLTSAADSVSLALLNSTTCVESRLDQSLLDAASLSSPLSLLQLLDEDSMLFPGPRVSRNFYLFCSLC